MQTMIIDGIEYDCPFADLLPPLSDEEREGLEEDIRRHGVLQPVICTEWGGRFVLIDGHNRASIAAKYGKNVPVGFNDYPSEKAMRQHALDLNLHRRHLTRDQKQHLITALLKEDPERSDRSIAAQVGVSDKTVGAKRAEMTSTAEIPQLETTTGKDGRTRKKPTTRKKPMPTPGSVPVKARSEIPRPPTDAPTATSTASLEPIAWRQQLAMLGITLGGFAKGAFKLSKRRKSDRDQSEVLAFLEQLRAVPDKFEREFIGTCKGAGGPAKAKGQPEEAVT